MKSVSKIGDALGTIFSSIYATDPIMVKGISAPIGIFDKNSFYLLCDSIHNESYKYAIT